MFEIIKDYKQYNQYNQSKIVSYFGNDFSVPIHVKYLATDSTGALMGYDREPIIDPQQEWWSTPAGPIETVSNVKFTGDWRDSLLEV